MDNTNEYELIKIGELAAMAGISVKALRVYE
jgi:DNA-binding transcriptional MerR regulator